MRVLLELEGRVRVHLVSEARRLVWEGRVGMEVGKIIDSA